MKKHISSDNIFDSLGDNYRQIHTKNIKVSGVDSSYFCEQKADIIKTNFPELCSIVDIGCGDGLLVKYLSERYNSTNFLGIDTSNTAIYSAENKYIERAEFYTDTDNNSYKISKFKEINTEIGLLVMSNVLHHVDYLDREDFIKAQIEYFKPRTVILFEHNRFNLATQYIVRTCEFDKGVTLVNKSKTERFIESLNYHTVESRYINFIPRWGLFKSILGIENYLSWTRLGTQFYTIFRKNN